MMSVGEVGEQPDLEYCRKLPKVELHAHLTGSITRPILQEIWNERARHEADFRDSVQDPSIALAGGNAGQGIGTFFAHFNTYLYRLISDLPSLIHATRAVLAAFMADGVSYLELRTTPRALDGHSPEDTIRAILAVMDEWNTTQRMATALILSIDRAKHTPKVAEEIVDLATRLREEGKPVVGVDLCGDPFKPIEITSFRPAFLRAKANGLKITLHYAEVPQSSSPEELKELLSWNPDRLGHVIHVAPDLRDTITKKGIAVELCLTCNVLAGMLPPASPATSVAETTIADHHFAEWWNGSEEPKLSLGTDDVGVFGSMSSEEHYLAAKHFGLSKMDLIKLSRNAIDGAFCKDQIMARFRRDLEDFEKS